MVMGVFSEAVSDGELDALKRRLPQEFHPLFKPAPTAASAAGMGYREFISRVGERMEESTGDGYGGRSRASLAVTSTLVTLGEYITKGEADGLVAHLPAELGDKLCGPHQQERAGEFSLGEFYRRVATREGISPEEASQHCRMVMRTLEEAAAGAGAEDLASQLPEEFEPLFGQRKEVDK
jgi:uncharacterized protein (DUF2267 family)